MAWIEPIPDEVLEDVTTRWLAQRAQDAITPHVSLALMEDYVRQVPDEEGPNLGPIQWAYAYAISDALPAYLHRRWTEMIAREKESKPCD